MLFNSLKFLFLFFPVVYVVFWRLRSRDQRYVWLTIAGYVFYGSSGLAHFGPNTSEIDHDWRPAGSVAFAVGYALCLALLAGGTASPFLYFQF